MTQMRASLLFVVISFFLIFAPDNDKNDMSQDLFKQIRTAIRKERLYTKVGLLREDIMKRFGIGRHRLNDMLNSHADGMSFPQFINAIRMEEAYKYLTDHPEMTIAEIASLVGFTAPNLREQFKRCYGITPTEYRQDITKKLCKQKF